MQISLTPALLLASATLTTAWTIRPQALHALYEPSCFGFFPPYPPSEFWRPALLADCHPAWFQIRNFDGPPCSFPGEQKDGYFFLNTIGSCRLVVKVDPDFQGNPACFYFPEIRRTLDAIFEQCKQGEAGGIILGQARLSGAPASVIVGNNPYYKHGDESLVEEEGWEEVRLVRVGGNKGKEVKWWL